MRNKLIATVTGLAAIGAATGVAFAGGGSAATASSTSRLDDGRALLPQAEVSEQQAIAAARSVASGALNEVDLEHYRGTLVFNVDVGASDVKVDATTGKVLASRQDDPAGGQE